MAFEDYSVKLAFARIEDELIDSMMRNLRRHLQEEKDEGFDWSQWQVEQLKYLEEYRRKNKKKFGPQFADINQRMQEAIQDAAERGQKDEEIRILQDLAGNKKIQRRYANQRKASIEAQGDAFFRINDNKLEALLTATQNDMEKAEQAVLRRANDQYRKIIFDAQVYANTGAGTVEKAVDMAAKDFLSHGIDSIEYKNGSRHTIKDYADMYIRTAERRAYLMGEGNKRKEWGMSLVLVNKRGSMRDGSYGTACPQCIPWLGKVLIDDVYSGGEPDGKHKLLSEAMAAGFLHPRCKDGFTTYFPGISSAPDPDATKKELKAAAEAEKEEVKENYVDRQEEKYERLAEYSLDSDNQRKYEARRKEWRERQAGRKEENEKQLIRGINADGASTLAQAYDRRRERYGLNIITGEQMLNNPFGNAVVDYTGVSVETAQAFNKTLEDLQEEYLSGITEIKVAEKKEVFGATFFARVEADDRIGRRVLIINPHKCQDLNSMVERIRELSAKGHCVKIPEGMEAEYVATHEFAHGLLNMQEHRKSLIGMDWRTTNKASREIKAMYQEYMDEIRSIEAEISELRKQPALTDFSASAEEQMEAFRKIKEAQDRLSSVRISKYSMENADEFMAEAFTQHRIGVGQSKYSDRVMDVLDREYSRSNHILQKSILERAKMIRTEVDLRKVSNSSIINMRSVEEIKEYFKNTHGISVTGFDRKDILDIKATLAGYDDMLCEYPEAEGFLKEISYNYHIGANGQINLDIGLSEVGKSGLRDYGTGIHETAHLIDDLRSKKSGESYASKVVELARKNLKLRINSRDYRNMVVRMIGPVKNMKDYDDPREIFAYAIETSKGGVKNPLADEIYRIMREEQL